ncbi:MAG: ATP-binding protein [Maioricimonas sp. JB045]|uniref:ATP-binding protein n=1 Tax=Maioricimonas sp. JC845 TaxID=3232138 RepID=UPI0034575425
MSEPERFDVTIPSETAAGQAIQERIIGLLESRSYPDRDVFGVRLALEEAIVNAIKHGNGFDPDKSVQISCEVDDERVLVIIEDQGEGFDPEDVPDPTAEENLERPSGRGIMLMRAFMTSVEYSPGGNRVRLMKVRGNGSDDED